jgi:hypothetical protein
MTLLPKNVAIVVCLISLLMLVASVVVKSPSPSPSAKTRAIIYECYRGISVLEGESNRPMAEMLSTNIETMNLHQELLAAIKPIPERQARHPLPLISNERELLDAWGNPINVARVQQMRNKIRDIDQLLPVDPLTSNSIVIWSNGANGSNNFGTCDDITFNANRDTINARERRSY